MRRRDDANSVHQQQPLPHVYKAGRWGFRKHQFCFSNHSYLSQESPTPVTPSTHHASSQMAFIRSGKQHPPLISLHSSHFLHFHRNFHAIIAHRPRLRWVPGGSPLGPRQVPVRSPLGLRWVPKPVLWFKHWEPLLNRVNFVVACFLFCCCFPVDSTNPNISWLTTDYPIGSLH